MRVSVKKYVKNTIKKHTILEPVCEIGSLQVVGQEGFADLRPFFPNKKYIGTDMRLGTGVDRIENVYHLNFKDSSIGTVLMLDTLEHVGNVYRAMDEVYRVLKPGGLVIISSVMKYPIHDHPEDYWRFTPSAFELLLERFEHSMVSSDGKKDFPTGVYGHGIKSKSKLAKVSKYESHIKIANKESSHYKILKTIKNNCKILEVGCDTGYITKHLKNKDCKVTCIEMNKKAAKKAKKYSSKMIIGDVEKLDLKKHLGNSTFDYIIFADLLEHLKEPESLLKSLRKHLKPKGEIIISIPNIAHASVRLELLRGSFDYQDTGILDNTHLHHFTKKSILKLIDDCGYYLNNFDYVIKKLTLPAIKKQLSFIGLEPTKELLKVFYQPESVAFQYIISAGKVRPKNYSPIGLFSDDIKSFELTEAERGEIEHLKKELRNLHNSRGYKIISFIHKIRLKIPFIRNI